MLELLKEIFSKIMTFSTRMMHNSVQLTVLESSEWIACPNSWNRVSTSEWWRRTDWRFEPEKLQTRATICARKSDIRNSLIVKYNNSNNQHKCVPHNNCKSELHLTSPKSYYTEEMRVKFLPRKGWHGKHSEFKVVMSIFRKIDKRKVNRTEKDYV